MDNMYFFNIAHFEYNWKHFNMYLILGNIIKDITISWCYNSIVNDIFRNYAYFLKAY